MTSSFQNLLFSSIAISWPMTITVTMSCDLWQLWHWYHIQNPNFYFQNRKSVKKKINMKKKIKKIWVQCLYVWYYPLAALFTLESSLVLPISLYIPSVSLLQILLSFLLFLFFIYLLLFLVLFYNLLWKARLWLLYESCYSP